MMRPGVSILAPSILALASGLAACGDEAAELPVDRDAGIPGPDAGPGDDLGPDGGPRDLGGRPPNDTITISGRTLRLDAYLDNQQRIPVGGAAVRALGVLAVDPVAAGVDGAYASRVPQNGTLILAASKPGYLESYEQLSVAGRDITGRNFYLAYQPYVEGLRTAFGVDDWGQTFFCRSPRNQGQCRYALLMGRVVDDGSYDNGTPTPMGDITADEFGIRVNGYADWHTRGPYFFFYTGRPNPDARSVQRFRPPGGRYQGGLFAYFVEVPAVGEASVEAEIQIASYAGGTQNRYFGPRSALAFRGGFTWVTVAETGQAPPPDPTPDPPPPPVDVDFANDVYPLFLTVDQGGLGCQGCHTNQGGQTPAGGLNLYGGPDLAYQGLNPDTYPQRVNVLRPADSHLLTKPLYEVDGIQDHPIFAFVSTQDPAYRTILGWIQGGALYDGQAPPPQPQVSFYQDVRPILYESRQNGGAGCADCHVIGVDGNTAPGGAYFGGTPNELHRVLTQQPPADNGNTGEPYRINTAGFPAQSLLLTNPLVGSPEPHPAKLFLGVNDPRYQTIYRWINEGYVNDAP